MSTVDELVIQNLAGFVVSERLVKKSQQYISNQRIEKLLKIKIQR